MFGEQERGNSFPKVKEKAARSAFGDSLPPALELWMLLCKTLSAVTCPWLTGRNAASLLPFQVQLSFSEEAEIRTTMMTVEIKSHHSRSVGSNPTE